MDGDLTGYRGCIIALDERQQRNRTIIDIIFLTIGEYVPGVELDADATVRCFGLSTIALAELGAVLESRLELPIEVERFGYLHENQDLHVRDLVDTAIRWSGLTVEQVAADAQMDSTPESVLITPIEKSAALPSRTGGISRLWVFFKRARHTQPPPDAMRPTTRLYTRLPEPTL